MPTYSVSAAHRDTGQEVTITLEAESPNDAARIINQQGFLIRAIDAPPVAPPAPPPPPAFDWESEDARYAVRDFARVIIHDYNFKRALRRTITRGVSEGVLVGLILFCLLPLIILCILMLLGATINGIGHLGR